MKKGTIVIVFIVVALLVAAGVYYFVYNKPHRDIVAEDAAYSVTATDLYNAFTTNPDAANQQYLNKVIQVTGVVGDKSSLNGTDVKIVLSGDDPMFGVACTFEGEQANAAQQLNEGDKATIKGLCTGYSGDDIMPGDVVLVKCSMVNPD